MLGNPVYKGELTNAHTHLFPEYLIIEPSVWEAVNTRRPRPPGRKDGGKWAVLGGLVFCGSCGHRMTPTRSGDAKYRYDTYPNRPPRKEPASINADLLEPLVVEAAYD